MKMIASFGIVAILVGALAGCSSDDSSGNSGTGGSSTGGQGQGGQGQGGQGQGGQGQGGQGQGGQGQGGQGQGGQGQGGQGQGGQGQGGQGQGGQGQGGTCAPCMQSQCSTEVSACISNTECAAILSCAPACNGDQACVQQCMTAHPNGAGLAQTVVNCVQSKCASECT
ncbi:MAG: hypothetical protein OZ928_11345 [Polyangiaceae bacterium]|nr:hypothetical protein [Polyangiaceae bacterium]